MRKSENKDAMRIALIQPGSYGDNINSTLMLGPLRKKFGDDAVIDVHTSTYYASAFYNNPLINDLIQYPANNKNESLNLVHVIPEKLGRYDMIFNPHPMINGDKWTSIKHDGIFGTNLICAWIRALEHADVPYDLPLETIMRLTDREIEEARAFVGSIGAAGRPITLVETGAESGQTFFDYTWMRGITTKLCDRGEIVLLSRREGGSDMAGMESKYAGQCRFVGHLSLRVLAEVYNHCTRFISISSGLGNVCNTNWCRKDIQWYEIVNSPVVTSAPIRKEGKTFWLENNLTKFLEIL